MKSWADILTIIIVSIVISSIIPFTIIDIFIIIFIIIVLIIILVILIVIEIITTRQKLNFFSKVVSALVGREGRLLARLRSLRF